MKELLSLIREFVKLIFVDNSQKPERRERVLGSYQWFLEKLKDSRQEEVQEVRGLSINPGKIYVFKYDPKYKEKYDYYDIFPVVLVLGKMMGKTGPVILGINLSWYPPKARKYFVENLMNMYKDSYKSAIERFPKKANSQKPVELDLYHLKLAMDKFGFSFAMRTYLPEQIKSPLYCISYENWNKAIDLDQPRIIPSVEGKITLLQIYRDFEEYVKKCRSNEGEIAKRIEENRKLGRYKFIK